MTKKENNKAAKIMKVKRKERREKVKETNK
jgi:hypothetical protein